MIKELKLTKPNEDSWTVNTFSLTTKLLGNLFFLFQMPPLSSIRFYINFQSLLIILCRERITGRINPFVKEQKHLMDTHIAPQIWLWCLHLWFQSLAMTGLWNLFSKVIGIWLFAYFPQLTPGEANWIFQVVGVSLSQDNLSHTLCSRKNFPSEPIAVVLFSIVLRDKHLNLYVTGFFCYTQKSG